MNLTVELVQAADDLPPRDSALQLEFKSFGSTLHDANVKYTQRSIVFDGGGALGYPLGQFILDFTETIVPVLEVAVAGWFATRKGRKVRLTLENGVELEANSVEEIAELAKVYEAIREGRPLPSDRDPRDPTSGR